MGKREQLKPNLAKEKISKKRRTTFKTTIFDGGLYVPKAKDERKGTSFRFTQASQNDEVNSCNLSYDTGRIKMGKLGSTQGRSTKTSKYQTRGFNMMLANPMGLCNYMTQPYQKKKSSEVCPSESNNTKKPTGFTISEKASIHSLSSEENNASVNEEDPNIHSERLNTENFEMSNLKVTESIENTTPRQFENVSVQYKLFSFNI